MDWQGILGVCLDAIVAWLFLFGAIAFSRRFNPSYAEKDDPNDPTKNWKLTVGVLVHRIHLAATCPS